MKKIFKITFITLLTSFFVSCATLTNTLEFVGDVANSTGMEEIGSVAKAGASISKATESITPENEYYIGRAVAATLLTNYKTFENSSEELYLNLICKVLTENSSNSEVFNGYHVKMLDTNEVNAFSTSGGHIFITKGMLKCAEDEDSLAAVIAHEIAHIQLKHSLKAIKASRWTNALKQTATAVVSVAGNAELANDMNDMVGDVFTEMVQNGYSKEQEFDSDTLALTLMADSGYNPNKMYKMLEMLEKIQNGNTGVYKTHPSPKERIKNIDNSIKKVKIPENTESFREKRFYFFTKIEG